MPANIIKKKYYCHYRLTSFKIYSSSDPKILSVDIVSLFIVDTHMSLQSDHCRIVLLFHAFSIISQNVFLYWVLWLKMSSLQLLIGPQRSLNWDYEW